MARWMCSRHRESSGGDMHEVEQIKAYQDEKKTQVPLVRERVHGLEWNTEVLLGRLCGSSQTGKEKETG